jgi:hypothetical protein
MLMFFVGAISAGLTYAVFKSVTDKRGFDIAQMLILMAIGGALGFIVKMIIDIFMTSVH